MTTTSTTTPAILLRRINYGDYDLILTLLTQTEGKVSVMAKAAKKSVKRFGGALELFSEVTAVFSSGPGRKLPFLQEAVLVQPFSNIRSNILKTAYASYWSETLHHWMMEGKKEEPIFQLLQFTLKEMAVFRTPFSPSYSNRSFSPCPGSIRTFGDAWFAGSPSNGSKHPTSLLIHAGGGFHVRDAAGKPEDPPPFQKAPSSF
jgi:hypothetical protein